MSNLKWKNITPKTKKSIKGWVAVMDIQMNQKIIWHQEIDDSIMFYFKIPQSLTLKQLHKI